MSVTMAMAEVSLNYSMSNVTAWIGANINLSNVSNLPYRASTTPGEVFLGLFRAFYCKDCETSIFHSSPQLRETLIGTTSIAKIPESYRNMFANSTSCTNMVIMSAFPLWTNACQMRVKTVIQEATSEQVDTNAMFLALFFTNQLWTVDGICTEEDGD